MHSRYALIRYLGEDGKTWRVGSGLIVRDRVVLTADHVANGSQHQVECTDRKILVKSIVRSGDADVDLAVLVLSGLATGLQPLPYARIDRSWPCRVAECVAVGFPFWVKDANGRASAQVEGFVRTGDYLHMLAGGADGQPLTLVGDRTPGEPEIPDGDIEHGADRRWAGMSGAVVVARGMVIGVISSHNRAKGVRSLTVTPLTALQRLPAPKRQEFCAALGIADIDHLTVLTGNLQSVVTADTATVSMTGSSGRPVAAFSDKVREQYANDLVTAGLDVPDYWDLATLDSLRSECQHKAMSQDASVEVRRAADLLHAFCLAAAALPPLAQVGSQVISSRKLQNLYLRHVGCRPDASTLEGMLILAALAGIFEDRRAQEPSDGQQQPLTALARFLLGIAGHWKGPGSASLDDPDLQGVAGLVTGQLRHQRQDAANYLDSMRTRTWALIELVAPDIADREWPTDVIVDSVSEHGDTKSQSFPCATATREGVEAALRDAVNWLPEGDVCVDLCLPRHWLDAGVEHWDVVEVGGWYEPMTRHFQPRLRWAMHRHHPKLRNRLRNRCTSIDWLADPDDIPVGVAGDRATFAGWLDARDLPGTKHPPYFTGSAPGARHHDPLGALLREGYGFVVWFGAQTPDDVRKAAAQAAVGLSAQERRDDLPDTLAARLKAYKPTVIWSDPDGRADFQLPPPRSAGACRKGGQ